MLHSFARRTIARSAGMRHSFSTGQKDTQEGVTYSILLGINLGCALSLIGLGIYEFVEDPYHNPVVRTLIHNPTLYVESEEYCNKERKEFSPDEKSMLRNRFLLQFNGQPKACVCAAVSNIGTMHTDAIYPIYQLLEQRANEMKAAKAKLSA